jgi:PAS domain S-box-containing protein
MDASIESRCRDLLASAPVGVFHTDPEGRCVYLNDRWAAWTGISSDTAVGRPWDQSVHPEDRVRVAAAWLRSVASYLDFSLEFRLRAPDGRTTLIWSLAGPLRTPTGDLLGYVGVGIDVTERKRAEQLLRESEDRFRTLVLSQARMVWTTDPRGEVAGLQPSWQAFTGQDDGEVLGWGWVKGLHAADAERVVAAFKSCLDSRMRFEAPCRVRHFEGGYRRFILRGVPVLDEREKVREWAIMAIEQAADGT